MKRTLLAIALVAVLLAGFYFLTSIKDSTQDKVRNDNQTLQENLTTYENQELGISFEYLPGPSGYVIEEATPSADDSGLLRTITLYKESDRTNIPEGGEAAPVIAVLVFDNAQKQFPQTWADTHIAYSNINLKLGDVQEAVVGGANAIRYMADGLYASENVVVAHGEFMYVITGQFMDEASNIRGDFSPLVESITFIPTVEQSTGVQGKLDIKAVCEGALAYMTFIDGESADAFVAECIAGEHPEVIEQFKAQLNLGSDVAI